MCEKKPKKIKLILSLAITVLFSPLVLLYADEKPIPEFRQKLETLVTEEAKKTPSEIDAINNVPLL